MMQNGYLLDVRELTKRFDGVIAVDRCSFALVPGKIYGLIGPNGSGKTTLFNCLTGIERRDAGEIRFRGERIDGLKPHQVARRGVARTFQIIRVFPELTALENLLVVSREPFEVARRRALELLHFVTLERLAHEYAGNLSYGQQKLLEFTRALMGEPTALAPEAGASGQAVGEVSAPAEAFGVVRGMRLG